MSSRPRTTGMSPSHTCCRSHRRAGRVYRHHGSRPASFPVRRCSTDPHVNRAERPLSPLEESSPGSTTTWGDLQGRHWEKARNGDGNPRATARTPRPLDPGQPHPPGRDQTWGAKIDGTAAFSFRPCRQVPGASSPPGGHLWLTEPCTDPYSKRGRFSSRQPAKILCGVLGAHKSSATGTSTPGPRSASPSPCYEDRHHRVS